MCLNQYPQTNQTRNSYGADLLPNQTHLVFMNTPTKWATRVRVRPFRLHGGGTHEDDVGRAQLVGSRGGLRVTAAQLRLKG